jgi:hypothetical protein
MIELTSTRYNYYAIVVNGQSVKDLGVIPDTQGNALGAMVWKDGGATDLHSWFTVLAEHKFLAYVERDAYTNQTKILRIEVAE